MIRLLRDIFIVFVICISILISINVVAWMVSVMEQSVENAVEQINATKVSELSDWYNIYRVGLIPALEVGLVLAFIGMIIGIFIYSRRR
ncbi:MAG: hypothetical protein QXT67_04740 [Candidatus Bathyarchaeia archaeon]